MKFCDFDNARLRRSTDRDDRIIGGEKVEKEVVMPWVVRLEFTDADDNTHRCGGTVVHKKFVLTTNECCKVSYELNES